LHILHTYHDDDDVGKSLSSSPQVDLVLGIAFPIHGHIGMNGVITDYVPKPARVIARYGALATTTITLIGLMKLNLFGPGITETYKSLWRRRAADKKEEEE